MKKKLTTVILSLFVLVIATSCSSLNLSGSPESTTIGSPVKTEWFDFTVDSATIVDNYNGYAPTEGNKLVDVVVTLHNTYGSSVPMLSSEFFLDDPADTEYFDICLAYDVVTGESMPDEFYLSADETVTYHLIYEVPTTSSNLSIFYQEFFDDGTEEGLAGDKFTVSLGI